MNRLPFSKAADRLTLSTPNTTSIHIVRTKPEPLRTAELQPIQRAGESVNGKPLISPLPSPAELLARRRNERLQVASSDVPVRNSTMGGDPYTCPELRSQPHRPGSRDAFSLPSRTSFKDQQPA